MTHKPRRYDLSPDNFIAGISGELNAAELGVYWVICLLIYSRGGPIPDDREKFGKILRGTHGRTINAALNRLEKLGKITLNDGEIDAKGTRNVIETAVKRVEKAVENGSKGGRPISEINEIHKPDGFYEEKLTRVSKPPPKQPPPSVEDTSLREVSAEPKSALAPPSPTFVSILTNQAGHEVPITEDDVRDYERTFPAVDVRQELREMRRWSMDNPAKRKTAGGIKRFVNFWLSREQNKGHTNVTNGSANNGKSSHGSFGASLSRRVDARNGGGLFAGERAENPPASSGRNQQIDRAGAVDVGPDADADGVRRVPP